MKECSDIISKSPRIPKEEGPSEKNSYCTISLLEGEEIFFNRLLSRDPSTGFSSHIYYRASGRVPFEWETQPGKPKIVQTSTLRLPPLSPPPGRQTLDRGSMPSDRRPEDLRTWEVLFRKKKKKVDKVKANEGGVGRVENFGFWRCEEVDSVSSPHDSCSSLSSVSFVGSTSSLNSPAPESRIDVKRSAERKEMDSLDGAWSCTPWRF